MHVLLLEPDVSSAEAFQALAAEPAREPCAVDRAGTLADALDALGRSRYDAVVVDGFVDGGRALEQLRIAAEACALLVLRTDRAFTRDVLPATVGHEDLIDLTDCDARSLRMSLRHAIERRRLQQALDDAREAQREMAGTKSLRDSLTGLPTGERLLEQVDVFIADAVRFGRALTLAIADIDLFGRLNQIKGPDVGDGVLVHVGQVLTEELRSSDVVGRLGADEYLMLMPGTKPEAAQIAVDRIQRRLQATPWSVADGRRIHVSVSVGIASLIGLQSAFDLVAAADDALEQARQRGRGGCVTAGAGIPSGSFT